MDKPVRHELKYIIGSGSKGFLVEYWMKHLEKDPYTNDMALTPVLSQYYDSPGLCFYEEKLDGIGLRNKVRLRGYGFSFQPGQTVFLEIKQRILDRVFKIRQRMDDFRMEQLDPANWCFDSAEKQGVFNILLEKYNLRPSAKIWYQREAYQGIIENDVRVTFDSCLTALHPGEDLSYDLMEDLSRKLLSDDMVILEVKATREIPPWVSDGVRVAGLMQIPVPKYVMAVEKLGMDRNLQSGVYE